MSQRRARETPEQVHARMRGHLPPELFEGHMMLLAFFDTLEQQRRAGDVVAWRAGCGPEPDVCRLEVMTPESIVEGVGKTWAEAHRALVDRMIEVGTRGAAKG